jgi:hypothetical protein
VIEDDAQNGPDHVDAHRSIAFVVSPYTKRGAVDSTMYTTAGMLRTMELILGLPPMSQYDAAATPMYNAFQFKPELAPSAHWQPACHLTRRTPPMPGSQRSAEFDFSREDAAPDIEFNEIIWKAVRGAASTMPGPVRSAYRYLCSVLVMVMMTTAMSLRYERLQKPNAADETHDMNAKRLLIPIFALVGIVALTPWHVSGWGPKGHEMSGRAAALKLPEEMPRFFRKSVDQLAYLSPEPDRWRDRVEADLDKV